MKASAFNLFNAVNNQSWDLWGGGWSKVSQGGLYINDIFKYLQNIKTILTTV